MIVKKCLEVIVSTNLLMISMNIHRNQLQFNQFASYVDEHSTKPVTIWQNIEMSLK